jgi:hypothetical protein
MSGNQNSPVKNIKYVHINPGLQGIHIMRLKTGLKSTCYAYKMIKYHNIPHRSPKSGKKKKKIQYPQIPCSLRNMDLLKSIRLETNPQNYGAMPLIH